jgi:hypothetical protein
MATMLFQTSPAEATRDGWFQVVFHLDGRPDPFPKRLVEVKTTPQALAAFEQYKADAAATGLPMAACMRVKAGRAPNGFKTATKQFYYRVNV